MDVDSIDYAALNIIVVIVLLLSYLIIVFLVWHIREFLQELKYLNMEIARTHGEERKIWIKRRRQLWLSLIPFIKFR